MDIISAATDIAKIVVGCLWTSIFIELLWLIIIFLSTFIIFCFILFQFYDLFVFSS